MTGIIRTTLKFGLITLAVGTTVAVGTAMIAGPQRTHMIIDQAQTSIIEAIDGNIEDPRILRSQLKELEAEYPERIGELRGDLAELRSQIAQLVRDQAVSERVVELSQADLDALQPLLHEAEDAQLTSNRSGQLVSTLRFKGRLMTTDQARSKAMRIQQTQAAYVGRSQDAAHDLVYLRQQEQRMEDLLLQLETEHTQFQAQLWQLNRQVDAIARNERLIDMLGERQELLDEYSSLEVKSLDGMTGRLNEVRSRQEAELEFLAQGQDSQDYEGMARIQIDGEAMGFSDMPSLEGPIQSLGEFDTAIDWR